MTPEERDENAKRKALEFIDETRCRIRRRGDLSRYMEVLDYMEVLEQWMKKPGLDFGAWPQWQGGRGR